MDHAIKNKLDYYHSPTQLRFDTWYALEDYTQRLRDKYRKGGDTTQLLNSARSALEILCTIERYTAFPSNEDCQHLWDLFDGEDYSLLAQTVSYTVRALSNELYRLRTIDLRNIKELNSEDMHKATSKVLEESGQQRLYFEVLIVDNGSDEDVASLKESLRQVRRPEDRFIYDIVVVHSLEDALIAALFNYNLQACVIRYGFPLHSQNHLELLQRNLASINETVYEDTPEKERGFVLAGLLRDLRPELDLYQVSNTAVEDLAGRSTKRFRRVFYRQEDHLELHLNILRGIQERYQTPFFTALREYSRQPTGVFHAMPISRGKSITKSHWIKDMMHFYGMNIFLAETSSTSGGLDSLLQPHGPIKKAQELAARAFGAKWTFFVTNGTSTSNKIVVQALVRPEDIVLVDRDCHKSHHYGMVLSGARVSYLDSYPLHDYSMYGAVPIREMKHRLLMYKKAGLLDQVRMLLLTNCTFDGVVYNVERVMEECLAIKPDLIFLWDEAWFAFAGFIPTYRKRTAMAVAAKLQDKYRNSEQYRVEYAAFVERTKDMDDEALLGEHLLPDPDKARVRVYSTQSTHKSLTSLRQGSMIHVYDQDFKHQVRPSFSEALMTHTSTSPNYQILASLDVGRRQAELEGFEMVQHQLELAMALRESVASHPLISKYFRFLVAKDLIPSKYRQSGIDSYYCDENGWANNRMELAWEQDDFVIDPTRLTLYLGKTGIDGDTFKNRYLMDKYGIQINKTSRNTVLFMTNIGTTRSSVAFLLEVLVRIATDLDRDNEDASHAEKLITQRRVRSLTEELPPLPDFSRFSQEFLRSDGNDVPDGKIRNAYFLASQAECEYFPVDDDSIEQEMAKGRDLVSACFVIPYPPGFPILVPGQVISTEILAFMRALDVKEIHGYQAELGLQVFAQATLDALNV